MAIDPQLVPILEMIGGDLPVVGKQAADVRAGMSGGMPRSDEGLQSVEDITIGDVTIPKGALVFVGTATANHDPRRFPDPEKVDVARRDNTHLAFGHGVHYCLGASLARLELRVVFSALLERHPHMRLACDPADIAWRPSAFRGPSALPVVLTPGRDGTVPPDGSPA